VSLKDKLEIPIGVVEHDSGGKRIRMCVYR
jgi:hypothetical protein